MFRDKNEQPFIMLLGLPAKWCLVSTRIWETSRFWSMLSLSLSLWPGCISFAIHQKLDLDPLVGHRLCCSWVHFWFVMAHWRGWHLGTEGVWPTGNGWRRKKGIWTFFTFIIKLDIICQAICYFHKPSQSPKSKSTWHFKETTHTEHTNYTSTYNVRVMFSVLKTARRGKTFKE